MTKQKPNSTSIRFAALAFAFLLSLQSTAPAQYFPGKSWEDKTPQEVELNSDALKNAVEFAKANEYSGPKDLRQAILKGFEREPFHKIKGPTKRRGGPAGMILKNGFVVAKWGDTKRVDMTFSVTKSYLSTVAGLAVDSGLIRSVNDPVNQYVWDGHFDSKHNSKITWHHLLNQSSDWSGELFGMPDWGDRPPRDGGVDDWRNRKLVEPGTRFEYNDVRVNLLSYSLLNVWREPLPRVLKQKVMDPIGASTTWRWYGYDDTWLTVDGLKMQCVSGGGHSGGGIFISTEDHARFGLMFSRNGKWNDKQLISKDWIEKVQKPSKANSSYGYMWWLNRGSRKLANVDSESVYYAAGFGGNYIVVDSENDLVVVARWLEPSKMGEFMALVSKSLK